MMSLIDCAIPKLTCDLGASCWTVGRFGLATQGEVRNRTAHGMIVMITVER
jgi:hypothetical protein